MDSNPDMKWCPYPACGRAVKLPEIDGISASSSQTRTSIPSDTSRSVDCGAAHYFCWSVLLRQSTPLTREQGRCLKRGLFQWNVTISMSVSICRAQSDSRQENQMFVALGKEDKKKKKQRVLGVGGMIRGREEDAGKRMRGGGGVGMRGSQS